MVYEGPVLCDGKDRRPPQRDERFPDIVLLNLH
jgi:hypothetical protein